MDWFTSDLHLDHMKVASYRGMDVGDMNKKVLEAFDVVHKGDRVFLLGDLGWKKNSIESLMRMLIHDRHSIVYWIKGNHDGDLFDKLEMEDLHKCQTMTIRGYGNYAPIFVSHYPQLIFNQSFRGAYQLHGHIHADTLDVPMNDALMFGKRLNVNIELNDYRLLSRDDVESRMSRLHDNLDAYLYKGTEEQKQCVVEGLKGIHEAIEDMYRKLEG